MLKSLLLCSDNTRDLGGLKMSDGAFTRRNVLWRSDAPVQPTAGDIEKLLNNGITTVIDMRTEQEAAASESFMGEEFSFFRLPIQEGSGIPRSMEAVPLSYMEVAEAENMPLVLKAIAEAEQGVLYYCSAGKDRTGVVSAIILMACGADRETVVFDYILSREYNRVKLEALVSAYPEIDRDIILANENSMRSFIDMFIARFGSAEGYFEHIGLHRSCLEAIRRKLLG